MEINGPMKDPPRHREGNTIDEATRSLQLVQQQRTTFLKSRKGATMMTNEVSNNSCQESATVVSQDLDAMDILCRAI